MRRSTGAILTERRPATIIRSAWRGLARKTSAPKREMSQREALADIISIAQQARPNVAGQSELLRPQSRTLFTWVTRMPNPSGGTVARGPLGVWVLEKYWTGAHGFTGVTTPPLFSSSIPT